MHVFFPTELTFFYEGRFNLSGERLQADDIGVLTRRNVPVQPIPSARYHQIQGVQLPGFSGAIGVEWSGQIDARCRAAVMFVNLVSPVTPVFMKPPPEKVISDFKDFTKIGESKGGQIGANSLEAGEQDGTSDENQMTQILALLCKLESKIDKIIYDVKIIKNEIKEIRNEMKEIRNEVNVIQDEVNEVRPEISSPICSKPAGSCDSDELDSSSYIQ